MSINPYESPRVEGLDRSELPFTGSLTDYVKALAKWTVICTWLAGISIALSFMAFDKISHRLAILSVVLLVSVVYAVGEIAAGDVIGKNKALGKAIRHAFTTAIIVTAVFPVSVVLHLVTGGIAMNAEEVFGFIEAGRDPEAERVPPFTTLGVALVTLISAIILNTLVWALAGIIYLIVRTPGHSRYLPAEIQVPN